MKKYTCWGVDKEDLTAQVVAAKDAGASFAYKADAKGPEPRRWRVCVTCSQGHKNIFEGED